MEFPLWSSGYDCALKWGLIQSWDSQELDPTWDSSRTMFLDWV